LRIPAPEEGEPFLLSRQPRHDVGEVHARRGRGDRAELAADVDRGQGLGIEGVVVARAAERPDEDAVDILGRPPGGGGGATPRLEHQRQRHAEAGEAADPQRPAPRETLLEEAVRHGLHRIRLPIGTHGR
jgi:hypothetical protein